MKRVAIVLVGPPGGGKTTLADAVKSSGSVVAIQTGQLLRREIEQETELGKRLKPILAGHGLAPTPDVIEVMAKAIREQDVPVVLFDGFPRNEEQIEPFFQLTRQHQLHLHAVVVIELAPATIKKRLGGRRSCPACGAVYHVDYDPPTEPNRCDKCGGPLRQRKDDTPEGIEQRLGVYERETQPVVEYFRANHPGITHFVTTDPNAERAIETLKSLLPG